MSPFSGRAFGASLGGGLALTSVPSSCFAAALLAAAAVWSLAAGSDGRLPRAPGALLFGPSAVANQMLATRSAASAPQIVRTGKGDRLGQRKALGDGLPVASVELIGASGVTILFRSRFGQVMFQSDPLTNTTYTAKDLAWPPFVVRSRLLSPVEERFPRPDRPGEPGGERPVGCEPVSSDIADPAGARLIGRCIAMASYSG